MLVVEEEKSVAKVLMVVTPDLLVRLQYLQLLEVAVVVHHQ